MKILLMIFTLLLIVPATAQIGSAFNYQGELLDNGSPANDIYDFIIDTYTTETGNNMIDTLDFNNVSVVNGLFSIANIDFGSSLLGNTIWLEIHIRKTSVGGNFEALTSRQKINSVPSAYESEFSNNAALALFSERSGTANTVSGIGAMANDVYTFNGSQWLPTSPNWLDVSGILFPASFQPTDRVVLGTQPPTSNAKLTVESMNTGINTQFKNTGDIYNEYMESNLARGYVGSIQPNSAETSESDFEIGTTVFNTSGKFHITTQTSPRLTITNTGKVGIGNTSPTGQLNVGSNDLIVTSNGKVGIGSISPSAKLEIRSSSSQSNEALRVSIDNSNKLEVRNNELYIGQDVKHSNSTNGLIKYMVRARCLSSGSSIVSSYNAINSQSVSIEDTGFSGGCRVVFPTFVNTRYWQVSAVSANGRHSVNCHTLIDNKKLDCQRTLSNTINDGDIMILVY